MSKRTYIVTTLAFIFIVAHAAVGLGETLEGRVYEGQTGTEPPPLGDAKPIEGATVSLYGSNDQNDDGTGNLPIQTTTTNADGWYSLTVRGAHDFYNIVQTNKTGYVDSDPSPAATSVGGTVKSSNWIQYRYEDIFVTPVTTTGNKFWDKKEGPPPADEFIYQFEGPSTITGTAGTKVSQDFYVTLTNSVPVEGWVIAAGSSDVALISFAGADTTGTVAANPAFAEFQLTQVYPSGSPTGATSGVVLDSQEPHDGQTLDPDPQGQAHKLLRVTIEATMPTVPATVTVEFIDDVLGDPRLSNVVVVEGLSVSPQMIAKTIILEPAGSPPGEEWDFGDAPDPTYPTLLASNGARHRIDPDVYLGSGVEADPDGQPGLLADGDDDDGVVFKTPLTPGTIATVTITASRDGLLAGWIDFDHDGNWDMPRDSIFSSFAATAGTRDYYLDVPADAVPGTTYARFRFSIDSPLNSDDEAPNGEVEDYLVEITDAGAGSVVIVKEAVPQDDTGFLFCVKYASGAFFDTLCQALRDPSDNQWSLSDLNLLESVTETVTSGWTLTDITITGDTDNGSTIDWASATVNVDFDEGEGIVITFKNEQTGEVQYDFGDAPDPNYPTLLASNGARHIIVPGVYLGSSVDPENDGQPDNSALGDDNDGNDDDDGVFWNWLMPGNTSEILVKASVAGILNAWLDLNLDGDWNDSGEQIFVNESLTAGDNILYVSMPLNAAYGISTARFRFSTTGGLSYDGPAVDGEVEDRMMAIMKGDYGDAPYPYPTALSQNGARHVIRAGAFLGSCVDYELDGQPGANAMGDDNDGNDDDDGVTFKSPLVPGQTATVEVTAVVPSGLVVLILNAWIDFDGNDDWADPGEQVITDVPVTAPGVTQTFSFAVPANANPATTYARFRLGSETGLSFAGASHGGEVEDYAVLIGEDGPYPPGAQDEYDFGDAPDVYGTLENNNGPKHIASKNYCLGSQVDAESNGQPSGNATGDDVAGVNDDDGVSWLTPLTRGGTAQVRITATVSDVHFRVLGWIDFNKNNSWLDPGEKIVDYTTPGSAYSFDKTFTFNVPANAVADKTFARFRVNFIDKTLDSPTGIGGLGEVEDYLVEITDAGAGSVIIIKEASPQDDTAFQFCANYSPFAWYPTLGQDLRDPSHNQWLLFQPDELKSVTETVTSGWTLTDITITGDTDNGSTIDWASATVNVDFDEGENIVITFKNERTGGVEYDFGDAPSPYPDASHELGGPWLGNAAPDGEQGIQPNPPGLGDDNTGIDDEDGATFDVVKSGWTNITVNYVIGNSGYATVAVWIDFDGNGSWSDPGDFVGACIPFSQYPPGTKGTTVWYQKPTPAGAKAGTTFARVRAYDHKETPTPDGPGGPGEVEDYLVEIKTEGTILPPGEVIGGTKFNDLNGNHQQDTGEPGLGNWVIWIDLNGNGVKDAGEETLTNSDGSFYFVGLPDGTYTVHEELQNGWTQTCPGGAGTQTIKVQAGQPTPSILFGNRLEGEGGFDFGDAPDSYGTLKANNGASHIAYTLHLGPTVDTEPDGQPGTDALGDDNMGIDDEDGYGPWPSMKLTPSTAGTWVSLIACNDGSANEDAVVAGWIDFDGDGQFDPVAEEIGIQNVAVPAGGQTLVAFSFNIPANVVIGQTFARFRLYWVDPNPTAAPSVIWPTGEAGRGEVEDYLVEIMGDFGDAPEGAVAYPSTGVIGAFPTCKGDTAGHIVHWNTGTMWFGSDVDKEFDGNGGFCPGYPPYDQDECYGDEAGLIMPEPYTIDAAGKVVPCPGCVGTPLGKVCETAVWGQDIDIRYTSTPFLNRACVNVLIDWNQDGKWGGESPCPGGGIAPEHVLVNYVTVGEFWYEHLSFPWNGSPPPSFRIGPNPGYVWARFTITCYPVTLPWDGSGTFDHGETEDYLLYVAPADVGGDLDFGDAPDSYKTSKASGGPCHRAGPLILGHLVDVESDTVPSSDALTDDNVGIDDDEDGIADLTELDLIAGQPALIHVTVSNHDIVQNNGIVVGWIDFGGDGQFNAAAEAIGVQSFTLGGGGTIVLPFPFAVPANAAIGTTYARFRFYRKETPTPPGVQEGFTPAGLAGSTGEVEDYVVTIQRGVSPDDRDYGDAPYDGITTFYPSANHQVGGPWWGDLSDLPDVESGMQRDSTATGDDGDAFGDDENGLFGANLVQGQSGGLYVSFVPGGSGQVTLGAWVDLNRDGDWEDAGEASGPWALDFGPIPAGGWPNPINVILPFAVPAQAQTGQTFARLRIEEGILGSMSDTGPAGAGEVEDHLVEIKASGTSVPPGGIIWGIKFEDLNGNGIWESTIEPVLPNWTIWLDSNQSGGRDAQDATAQTDGLGMFQFSGLAPGAYLVGEDQQAGWMQTWPTAPETHTVTVQSSTTPWWGILFGNLNVSGTARQFDWGDAPDPSYPTLRASNGAYHTVVPGFFLGGSVDPDADGQPAPDARGDDHDGNDDDDGVFFLTPLMPGQPAEVEVVASAGGIVDAWIDFDVDGSWAQVSDQILTSQPVLAGSNVLSLSVPAGAATDVDTFARFRFSTQGALSYEGPAQDGEVEDYHVLTGADGPLVPGEGDIPHVKWSQPPIEVDPNVEMPPVFCGWDEPARSTQSSSSRRQWRMDADDFRCLGPIPITRIRWWGGYKAWTQSESPESQPEIWHIGIWANQVEGITQDESFLERLVWSVEVPNERVHRAPTGLIEFPQQPGETCFVYEIQLESEEWFHQTEFESNGDVFWISITAVYPADVEQVNQWGWMTRPHLWGRGAVMPAIFGEWPTYDERLFPGRIYPIENSLLCGQNQAYDMCFELLTEQPWIKWDQPFTGIREWPHYEDHESYAIEDPNGDVLIEQRVSDDWPSERLDPVVAVAWNGSYMGYGYEACTCENPPKPVPPDYFVLTLRTNAPASANIPYEHPGPKIWEYEATEFDEVLIGFDKHPHGEPNEAVFRYMVRLPKDAWFWQDTPGQIYWFSVMAVYRQPAVDTIISPWAWTSHRYAFGSTALGLVFTDQGVQMNYLYDQTGERTDMSFTLFTGSQPDPVAHWRFDELEGDIAFDSIGEHHGAVHGATWTEGIVEGAVQFNGLNGYVDCGDDPALGPELMTMSLWIRPEHMGGPRYVVCRAHEDESTDYAILIDLSGQIEFVFDERGSGPGSVTSATQLPWDEWAHVAVTRDRALGTLYINGQEGGSQLYAGRSAGEGFKLTIGSRRGETRFFNGRIDDVRLYHWSLPAESIAELATP